MGNLPKSQYLSIEEAAKYLSVSTKTLRRWEASGVLSPVRTKGGHRRYTQSDLTGIKDKEQKKPRKIYVKHLVKKTVINNLPIIPKVLITEPIELYQPFILHPHQKRSLKALIFSFFSFLIWI